MLILMLGTLFAKQVELKDLSMDSLREHAEMLEQCLKRDKENEEKYWEYRRQYLAKHCWCDDKGKKAADMNAHEFRNSVRAGRCAMIRELKATQKALARKH